MEKREAMDDDEGFSGMQFEEEIHRNTLNALLLPAELEQERNSCYSMI